MLIFVILHQTVNQQFTNLLLSSRLNLSDHLDFLPCYFYFFGKEMPFY